MPPPITASHGWPFLTPPPSSVDRLSIAVETGVYHCH